jgi:hypothetical protein
MARRNGERKPARAARQARIAGAHRRWRRAARQNSAGIGGGIAMANMAYARRM